jgi:hypothetical protein
VNFRRNMPRRSTKRRNSDFPCPWRLHRTPRPQNPCNLRKLRVFPTNLGGNRQTWIMERRLKSRNTMPVESVHTTPSSEPRRRQEDEESDPFDVDFNDDSDPFSFRDERPRQRSFSEDEAEADAYFKKYVTNSFHPDDKAADNKIRVIHPLVTQPPAPITIQAVPNLSAQERQSARCDHRRTCYKTRFWPYMRCHITRQSERVKLKPLSV